MSRPSVRATRHVRRSRRALGALAALLAVASSLVGLTVAQRGEAITWNLIPYVSGTGSTTAGGVTVDLSNNGSYDFGGQYAYNGASATFTFTPAIGTLKAVSEYQNDAGASFETFTLEARDANGGLVWSDAWTNTNETRTPTFSRPVKTLTVTHTKGGPPAGGALLNLSVPPAASCSAIPVLTQGSSTTIEGTTVTATVQTAADGGSDRWLYFSDNVARTSTLTFSPAISEMKLVTANHADTTGLPEVLDFTGKNASGSTVFTNNITDSDTTQVWRFAEPVTTLKIDYSPQNGTRSYGSFLSMYLGNGPSACGQTRPSAISGCGNSVDWTTAGQPASTMTGAFSGGGTVTLTLGTGGSNSGLAFPNDWGTNTATNGAFLGRYVTNKEAMAVYGTSGGNPVGVSFSTPVTDPVVFVNYVDANTELDFGSNSIALLDSNPTANVSGNKVTINGGNNGTDGFAVQVFGVFSTGSDKLSFTYKVGNDTMGISFAKAGGTCPQPTCDFIPFGSQSSNTTVGSTTVNVTQTSAVNWGSGSYWLFQSNGRQYHKLTFNPAITELQVDTAYHADSPGGVEKFAFVARDANGDEVFTKDLINVDTTKLYGFTTPVKTLEATFTPQNGTVNFGSLVRYKIPSTPGACGVPVTPPPPPVVTAASSSVYFGKTTPTITYSVAPSSTQWTTQPVCNVYDLVDTSYATPLTGVLSPGSYVTHCKSAVSNPVLTVTYQDGTFVVAVPPAIEADSYVDDDALTYPGVIPTIGKTIDDEIVDDLTTQPTCAVFEEDWGGFDVPTALTGPLDAGTYVTRCHGAVVDGDRDRVIRYIAGSLEVNKANTSIAYAGDDFIGAGGSLNLGRTLTGPAGCTGAVSYSLDVNPITGAAGPYAVTSPVSTSGWLAGAYVLTVTYAGDSNCNGSSNTATLTVFNEGAGWGGGWFSVSGGKNTFGFVVQQFERSRNIPAYTKGQVAWQSPMWRFKGTLNAAYSNANRTQGTASGSGSLWYWQKSGATGNGTWVKATTADANVTISYWATTPSTKKRSGEPGRFGISFTGTPVAGVPTLPAVPLTTLNEGNIKVA